MRPHLAAALTSATLLAGCLYTPQELREAGNRFEYSRPSAPRTVAYCMARNLMNQGLRTTVLDGAQANSYEVLMGGEGSTQLAAEVIPSVTGSQITVWINPINTPAEAPARIALQGC